MIRNISRHWNQSPCFKERLWFPGTTRVRKGMGLCYDIDVAGTGTGETATDPWGRRGNSIAVPSSSNNMFFAGVSSMNYPANPSGQYIDVLVPGSVCQVEVGLPSTIYSQAAGTLHTCSVNSADAGRFTLQGLPGRGTAVALETQAAAAGGNVCFKSLDGSATTAWVDPSLTISETGIGTAVGYGDSDIDPTEFIVVILGGADDTYGGDTSSGELVTIGAYPIVTAPTADTITIATDIGDCDVTLYVIKNTYPTVLCYLEDDGESGCLEVLTPQDSETVQSMVGGTTILCGGYTMAEVSDCALADGMNNGLRKAYACLGALTTAGYAITATNALDIDGGAAGTITLDAADEYIVLEFNGIFDPDSTAGVWQTIGAAGTTRA